MPAALCRRAGRKTLIRLYYGDDSFSIDEQVEAMVKEVSPPDLRDVNMTTFDGREVGFPEFCATCSTVPFLAEKRLVVVRGLLSRFERRPGTEPGARDRQGAAEWEALGDYLPTVPETTDVVFADSRIGARNPLLSAIKPHAEVKTFPLPRGNRLSQWVRERAQTRGVEIEPRAAQSLTDMVGPELRVLDSEIQKLAAYGRDGTITHGDVQELVSNTREASIFMAVDAVIEGRPGVALGHVGKLMQAGSSAGYVLAMLARQVRLLMLAKDLRSQGVAHKEMGPRLGVSGYPLQKTLEQAGATGFERLSALHRMLVETDLLTKSTAGDDEVALDMLIAEAAATANSRARRR